MNKLTMNQKVTEILQEAARQKDISMTTDVMGCIPDLIESVEIDSEYIRKKVETELNKKTGNPINALLKLMGLRIVRTRMISDELGLGDAESFTIDFEETDENQESMLKIDPEKLALSSGKMAATLAAVEAGIYDERRKYKEQGGVVFGELDKKTQECNQLSADLHGQRAAVMEHTQYMLSVLGRDSDSPIAAQLVEMLEDIGVTVYWEAEQSPFSNSAMFTELKCENPESRRIKPCLANEETILMKGIRFTSRSAE